VATSVSVVDKASLGCSDSGVEGAWTSVLKGMARQDCGVFRNLLGDKFVFGRSRSSDPKNICFCGRSRVAFGSATMAVGASSEAVADASAADASEIRWCVGEKLAVEK
jgi:hypothetical protein